MPRIARLRTYCGGRTLPTKGAFRASLRGRDSGRFHGNPGRRQVVRDAAQTERAGRAGLGPMRCRVRRVERQRAFAAEVALRARQDRLRLAEGVAHVARGAPFRLRPRPARTDVAGRAERTIRHPFEAVERPWRAFARKDVGDAGAVVSSRTSCRHDGGRAEVARRARSTTFWCCGARRAEVPVVAALRRTKILRYRYW